MSQPRIRPQKGPQTMFLSTRADIAIYGGAAGGGKTFAELIEPLRHIRRNDFNSVIFRRNMGPITRAGGLMDAARKVYVPVGAEPVGTQWRFPKLGKKETGRAWGMTIDFAHLKEENTVFSYDGAEIPLIQFDELPHFTEYQFTYMMGRNRSMTGVRGYMRATCNPDPHSWVKHMIRWWLDKEGRYADPTKAGKVRYFIRRDDDFVWGDSPEDLVNRFKCDPIEPKSMTFIPANVHDNKILMKTDPGYLANLMALTRVERMRKLEGDWAAVEEAGMYFSRGDFKVRDLPPLPKQFRRLVRFWDRAGTKKRKVDNTNDPDWTVGLLMGETFEGEYWILHVERFQGSPGQVESRIKEIAKQDGRRVTIGLSEDPGQAGKFEASYYVKELAGYEIVTIKETTSKTSRAKPFMTQVEHGRVYMESAGWNKKYLDELENFIGDETKGKVDQVDASSGAFWILTEDSVGSFGEDWNSGKGSTFATGFTRTKAEW